MSDTGSQSLFAVLMYEYGDPYVFSIVKLDKDINGYLEQSDLEVPVPVPVPVRDGKWVAHFKVLPESPQTEWVFSPPASSSGDLYILPDWPKRCYYRYKDALAKLHGVAFNCITKGCKQIKPPHAPKMWGVAVTVGLDIYFMTHPGYFGDPPFENTLDAPVFERYSPSRQLWEKLEPFPAAFADLSKRSDIVASAVWDDHTILLNVNRFQIWAYNVCSRKWYHVLVRDDKEAKLYGYGRKYQNNRCYAIKGEAFVVQNTIYALSDLHFDSVLALSIKKRQVPGGGLVYSCSIRSELFLPSAKRFQGIPGIWEQHSLAHMDKHNLCFLRSCRFTVPVVYHPIQVTYIKLTGEGQMVVSDDCIYRFEFPDDVHFEFVLCFGLPKVETAASEPYGTFIPETTGSEPCGTFILDPSTGFVSKQEDKTDLNLEPENGKPFEEKKVTLPKGCPLFNVQATSGMVNDSSQTKTIDEQDFEQEIVVRSCPEVQQKKRKMSEIDEEEKEVIPHGTSIIGQTAFKADVMELSGPERTVRDMFEVTNRRFDLLDQKFETTNRVLDCMGRRIDASNMHLFEKFKVIRFKLDHVMDYMRMLNEKLDQD